MDIEFLSRLNPHERDNQITFDEASHTYTIDGDTNYMSVTAWNHSHFKEFDADKIIDSMMSRKSWPNSQYYGMTK